MNDPSARVPLPPSGDSVSRRTIALIVFAVALVLALVVFLYALSWNSRAAGFLSDDAVYLLMADGFSPYRMMNGALFHYVLRQSLFPPFYPMLLALFGGGSGSLLVSHWITTTTLALSLLVFGLWTYRETKNWLLAVWLLLVLGMLPETLLHNLAILSEYPYLLLSLIALWLAARGRNSARDNAAIAICVGLAAVTRTAGLSLVAALGVWLFRNGVRGRVKWLILAIAPSVVWFVYKTYGVGSHGGYGSLWGGLWVQIEHNGPFRFVPRFLGSQAEALWMGLLTNLAIGPSTLTRVILAFTLLVGLPVWVRRLWLWRLDALYLLIGGAMVLVYPFPLFFTRLVLPWVPILLLYACLGVMGFAGRWHVMRERPMLGYAFLAALSLTLLPSSGFIVHRFFEPIPPGLAVWKHTRYWYRLEGKEKILDDLAFRQTLIDASTDVPKWVPDRDCVFGVYTAIGMLYGRRIYQQPPSPAVRGKAFEKRSHACPYYFLISSTGRISGYRVGAFYPLRRLPAHRARVLHVWRDGPAPGTPVAILVRLKSSN